MNTIRRITKNVLTYTVYILFFLVLVWGITPAFEEVFRIYGWYPFLLGIGAYFLVIFRTKSRSKEIENDTPNLKVTEAFVIALGCIFAAPVIFSKLYLALPGTLPWAINPASTADVVNEARVCKDDPINEGDKCIFKISSDLEFEILGVGTSTPFTVLNVANPAEKSNYYIAFSARDPCIRIKIGEKISKRVSHDNFVEYMSEKYTAWLSPFDVTAYNSYYECKEKTDASLRKFSSSQEDL